MGRAAHERKRARGERVEGAKPSGHFPAEQALIEQKDTDPDYVLMSSDAPTVDLFVRGA